MNTTLCKFGIMITPRRKPVLFRGRRNCQEYIYGNIIDLTIIYRTALLRHLYTLHDNIRFITTSTSDWSKN